MNKVIAIIKFFVNILLFAVYSFFAIILGNFLYGFYVAKIQNEVVPATGDPIHLKLAILFVIITLVITLLLRKYLYLEVFSEDFIESEYLKKEKKANKLKVKQEDELEIYVNKEI